jgi:hypothetical protein
MYTKDLEVEKNNVKMDSYMPCDALAHKLSILLSSHVPFFVNHFTRWVIFEGKCGMYLSFTIGMRS